MSNIIIDLSNNSSVLETDVWAPSNYASNIVGYDIIDGLTNTIDDLVNNYLRNNCYGITIEEVLSLIREHQPERLLWYPLALL